MNMRFEFTFVLYWVIPDLKRYGADARMRILEQARQNSMGRIRAYAGWVWGGALILPFLFFFLAFLQTPAFSSEYRFVATAVWVGAAVLTSSILRTACYAWLIKPAVQAQIFCGPEVQSTD